MAVSIIRVPTKQPATEKKSRGHTKAAVPTISLDLPGRLRIAHLMSLFAVSHSTLYAGMKAGHYPQPDGRDGKRPFWNTETVRSRLSEKG